MTLILIHTDNDTYYSFACALFADQLSEALTDQVSLLNNLESLLETRSHHLRSTINLLGELQNTTHRIQQLVS